MEEIGSVSDFDDFELVNVGDVFYNLLLLLLVLCVGEEDEVVVLVHHEAALVVLVVVVLVLAHYLLVVLDFAKVFKVEDGVGGEDQGVVELLLKVGGNFPDHYTHALARLHGLNQLGPHGVQPLPLRYLTDLDAYEGAVELSELGLYLEEQVHVSVGLEDQRVLLLVQGYLDCGVHMPHLVLEPAVGLPLAQRPLLLGLGVLTLGHGEWRHVGVEGYSHGALKI
mmetsp:Transcript_15787/g.26654  ORF Transcript_15787/g.26654 Transcript_15787/m.26654 type:complete len:224 (-) Transcript_15787:57-728(-)